MEVIDHTCATPGENLALEEVLLDQVEQGHRRGVLRFWESPVPFVVLGTGQVLAREVFEQRCIEDGVPIMRRCTAGGCVLQGPGSLNYALSLRYEDVPEVASLHESYRFLIGKVCRALQTLGVVATQAGISDIAVDGLKISGNAQRRRRRALLHHGTLLYRADMDGMSHYLREPEDRPDYRSMRPHREFVTQMDTSAPDLCQVVTREFAEDGTSAVCTEEELSAAYDLAAEKYDRPAWIHRR
jgi:lipoate---protein ligase